MSEGTYKLHWPEQQLQQSSDKLKTYSGEYLDILGSANNTVEYSEQQVILPFVIVKGGGQACLGGIC